MLYSQRITICFDPVKEYEMMTKFEKQNPDWAKKESTTAFTYIKEYSYILETPSKKGEHSKCRLKIG